MKIKLLLASLLLSFTCSIVSAQDAGGESTSGSESFKDKLLKSMSVGLSVGPNLYYGDIRQYDWFPVMKYKNEWGFGAAVNLTKALSPAFSLQGQLLSAGLRGTKRAENLYFKGNTMEMTLNGIVNISNIIMSKRVDAGEKKFGYYFSFGVGLTSFRARKYQLEEPADKYIGGFGYESDGETKLPRTTETVIPLGFGFKYKINSNLSLNLDLTSRICNSDKLDGTARTGTANDFYQYTGIGATYKLTKKGAEVEDEEWTNPLEDMYSELMKGQEKLEGLSSDSDADGVADIFDKEANTPKGVAVDGSGKSMDVDEDGVADYMDADRFTPKGAKVDGNGRELDADGDGVPDSRDLEPNTKKGTLVNFQGVTINATAASTTVSSGASSGYLPSVFFKVNSSSVDYSNYERLATVAQVLKTNPNVKLNVIGNADKSGSETYNMEISKRRAQSVVDHLVKIYGISANRLNVVAKGSQAPLATGSPNAEVNRRVDFEIAK